MELRKIDMRRIICSNDNAAKGVIKRAIRHALDERKPIEIEDIMVKNFLSDVYGDQKRSVREGSIRQGVNRRYGETIAERRYTAYFRLRDIRLLQQRERADSIEGRTSYYGKQDFLRLEGA